MDGTDSDQEDLPRVRLAQPDPMIDTSRFEEIPTKEPKLNAVPLKSALKKRGSGTGSGSGPGTPTQENRPLGQLHGSFRLTNNSFFNLLIFYNRSLPYW